MSNRHIGITMLIAFPAVLIGAAYTAAYFSNIIILGIGGIIVMLWVVAGVYLWGN
jgi:uncharacterized membrane protein (DUF485 family)